MPSTATQLSEAVTMSLGSRLKQAREEAGLSRRKLADETGIPAKMIEKYEYGTAEPPLGRLKLLCQTLGIPVEELMEEVDPAETPGFPRRGSSRGHSRGSSRDPLTEARRKVEEAVVALGGKVAFGPLPDVEQEEETALPGQAELLAIRDLVTEKGIDARGLPKLIVQTEGVLARLDYDDLMEARTAIGAKLSDCPGANEVMAAVSGRDRECNNVQARLIVAAIYGPEFEELSVERLDALARQVNEEFVEDPSLDDPVVRGRGVFEDDEPARDRLLKELPPHLIKAVKKRAPIPLPVDELPHDPVPSPDAAPGPKSEPGPRTETPGEREARIERELFGEEPEED